MIRMLMEKIKNIHIYIYKIKNLTIKNIKTRYF